MTTHAIARRRTLAVDAADAGDHAVGRRVADQVVELAPAALRREREPAVLDEAAGVARDRRCSRARCAGRARGAWRRLRGGSRRRAAPRGRAARRDRRATRSGSARRRRAVGRRRARPRPGAACASTSRLDDVADLVAHAIRRRRRRRRDLVLHLHRLDDRNERAASRRWRRPRPPARPRCRRAGKRSPRTACLPRRVRPAARRRGSGRSSARRASIAGAAPRDDVGHHARRCRRPSSSRACRGRWRERGSRSASRR